MTNQRISATAQKACPCIASGVEQKSLKDMEGCLHETFWRCVSEMKKKQNKFLLDQLNSTTMMSPTLPESGYCGLELPLRELQTPMGFHGVKERVESLFRSIIMANLPDNGLVDQSTDGSLNTSCPRGQLALAGIDYSEIERRVLSWRTSYQPLESPKRDTLLWLFSGQLSEQNTPPCSPTGRLSGGSMATMPDEKGLSS